MDCQLCATGNHGQIPTRSLKKPGEPPRWAGSEVRTLISQGPVENRIDLTMVGDGYTAAEKERFFEDAARMTREMFEGQTFASYLPLFNVHAVFVPSKDSGLSDGDRKDTALGLYRSPSGSKRAIQVGKSSAAEKAIQLAPDTDYPILIANDNFYGGLGGRFAITTRSPESGTMVLRHELGHNFGMVGEEYDGGQVYRGANHSRSTQVPWSHWAEGAVKTHKATSLIAEYPWKNLSQGALHYNFEVPRRSDGRPPLVTIDLSSVGWQTDKDVQVLLDGQPVQLEGLHTEDRSFFRSARPFELPPGKHKLTVQEAIADGNNVLGSVRVLAFDPDYDFTPDKVGAFPTFDSRNALVGYRPTHASCLMRDMRHTEFCAIDKENMWHKFLQRIRLVDSLESHPHEDGGQHVVLKTPPLEGLQVRWYRVGPKGGAEEIKELAGTREWVSQEKGEVQAEVSFQTPEVRHYDDKFKTRRSLKIA